MNEKICSVLFSGGTDSLCAAALAAEKFDCIHLLTFFDYSNANSPIPVNSANLLRTKFPNKPIRHFAIDTNAVVKHLSYHHYFQNFLKYKLLLVANCAFTSLSWHIVTLLHNQRHAVEFTYDGLTKEMMHLPGHMDSFIFLAKDLYKKFGINYQNPVREWDVPKEQTLEDRFIIDRHGFLFPSEEEKQSRTTGQYLFELGIFDQPNIKGSSLDRSLQHDCYPFVLYNLMLFWVYLHIMPLPQFEAKMMSMLKEKINYFKNQLDDETSRLNVFEAFYKAKELSV